MTETNEGQTHRDEPELEPEKVADLEPESDDADVVRGGAVPCLNGTRNRV